MEYYILTSREEKRGPFTLEQLGTELKSRTELVWSQNFDDWKRAEDLPELKELVEKLPPDSPRHEPIKTWQKESILITIVNGAIASCFILLFPFSGIAAPLGIIGIIKSIKAEELIKAKKWEQAQEYAVQAKKWAVWGFFIGLVGGLLSIVCIIVVLLFSFVLVDAPKIHLPF